MTRMRTAPSVLRLLAADAAGSLLPIAAITLILLASLIGGGIDMSRAYQVKNRLQYACDAGVLAGRRTVDDDGFDTAARNQANAFFNGNFDEDIEGATGTTFTPSTPDNGNTIEGIARTNVDTVVMRIFGFDSIALSASCSASMSVGNSDVMMVLDVTGSMAGEISDGNWHTDDPTRLEALQDAMKNFYDTVATATSGSNARVRYGFVPYSSTVNVGYLLEPEWLVDQYEIQSREPEFYDDVNEENQTGWYPPVHTTDEGVSEVEGGDWSNYNSNTYGSRDSCEDAMPADAPWQNVGGPEEETETRINGQGQKIETITVSQTQQQTNYECSRRGFLFWVYYVIVYRTETREVYSRDIYTSDPIYETVPKFKDWIYHVVNYDVSEFKTGTAVSAPVGYEGAPVSSIWNGCIEERGTSSESSFSFSKQFGMSPYTFDLDLDLLPDPSNPATQWRPMWPEVAYYRTDRWGRLTDDEETDDGEKAGSYCPYEAQLFAEMTEDEFDDYADELQPIGSTYHDIGMLWGGRLSSPDGLFASNVTEAPDNAGAVARHLIFMTDGRMEPNYRIQSAYGIEYHDRRVTENGTSSHTSRHTSRFLAVCEAIKAKGIRIWVIAFGTELTGDLESCASSASAFTASNANELNSSFQEIAKDVGELRVVQ